MIEKLNKITVVIDNEIKSDNDVSFINHIVSINPVNFHNVVNKKHIDLLLHTDNDGQYSNLDLVSRMCGKIMLDDELHKLLITYITGYIKSIQDIVGDKKGLFMDSDVTSNISNITYYSLLHYISLDYDKVAKIIKKRKHNA